MAKRNPEPRWTLLVSYPGYNLGYDERIRKTVGRTGNSGFGADGRDLDFSFHQRPAAERALSNVKRLRGIAGLTAEIIDNYQQKA